MLMIYYQKPPEDGNLDPGTVSAFVSLAHSLFFHSATLKE